MGRLVAPFMSFLIILFGLPKPINLLLMCLFIFFLLCLLIECVASISKHMLFYIVGGII